MSNTEIVWGTPPKSRGGRTGGVWEKRLAPLANRPNEWARVYTGTVSTARSTSGALRANDKLVGYEFASRKITEDEGGVWARYVGETTEAAEISNETTYQDMIGAFKAVIDSGTDDDGDFEEDISEDEDGL